MIAAQYQHLRRNPRRIDMLQNKLSKVRWSHPRIAAELIHLVTRSFDKKKRSILSGLLGCCTNDPTVSGTYRVNARRRALFPLCEMGLKQRRHRFP
jgi:hypothetical protein